MSEFDVNLIRAFAKCPAFYDKSNPNFKDRTFTENAWKEISLQLGFEEKVLRDRMFQLRNRYNLEKRKVEMQDSDSNAKSTWPLFDHMTFLDGHIRPRKSYKSIMTRSVENNNVGHQQQANLPFASSGMFFNHRNTPAVLRQYPQHSVQRLQQLANHFQMMGTNDDSQIDLSGDSLSGGLSSNFALEMSLLEDDRLNPLQLLQQQQNHQMSLQTQFLQQPQRKQQTQRDIGGNSDNNSEIKTEYYSDSDDDEDGLDHHGDENKKLNSSTVDISDDRIMDGQPISNQKPLFGDISGLSNDGGTAGNSGNESQLRTDSLVTKNGAGCDEENTLPINPMDLLITRSSTGSNQSGVNFRYLETLKRKGDTLNNQRQTQSQHSTRSNLDVLPHSQPRVPNQNKSLSFKRRRRNYQNMVPQHMVNASSNDNVRTAGNYAFGRETPFHTSQASGGLLANQVLDQLQGQNPWISAAAASYPAIQMLGCNGGSIQNNTNNRINTMDKYTAFGQFLSSSLAELDSSKAMDLIGKFTMEMVNALKEQNVTERGSSGTDVRRSASMMDGKPFHQFNDTSNMNANSNGNLIGDTCSIVDNKYEAPQF